MTWLQLWSAGKETNAIIQALPVTLGKEKRTILPITNHVINTALLTLAMNQVERELEDTDKRNLV